MLAKIPYSTSRPEGAEQDKRFAQHPPPRQPPPLSTPPRLGFPPHDPFPAASLHFGTTPTLGPSFSQQPVFTSAPTSVPPDFHASPPCPHLGVFSPTSASPSAQGRPPASPCITAPPPFSPPQIPSLTPASHPARLV